MSSVITTKVIFTYIYLVDFIANSAFKIMVTYFTITDWSLKNFSDAHDNFGEIRDLVISSNKTSHMNNLIK